jgi:hypothetical protein
MQGQAAVVACVYTHWPLTQARDAAQTGSGSHLVASVPQAIGGKADSCCGRFTGGQAVNAQAPTPSAAAAMKFRILKDLWRIELRWSGK